MSEKVSLLGLKLISVPVVVASPITFNAATGSIFFGFLEAGGFYHSMVLLQTYRNETEGGVGNRAGVILCESQGWRDVLLNNKKTILGNAAST